MSQIVPKGYITIDSALAELLDSDVETTILKGRWERTGRSLDGPDADIYTDLCAQQNMLLGFLHLAVRTGAIETVALDLNWQELRLPDNYWMHPAGVLSMRCGHVLAEALPDNARPRFNAIPICFRRQQWGEWLASRTLKGEVAALLAKRPKPKTTPAGYLRTSAALGDFYSRSEHWSRLHDQAKSLLSLKPDQEVSLAFEATGSAMRDAFLGAVDSGVLTPTIWDETSGQWREVASEHWSSSDGTSSLYRGELVGSVYGELDGAPVCLERRHWMAWLLNYRVPSSREPDDPRPSVSKQLHQSPILGRKPDHRRAVKEKLLELYPEGVPGNIKVSALLATLEEHGIRTSDTTVKRVLGRRADKASARRAY